MKSFVWLTTIFLLCNQLAYAAHITPIHAHRQHRRTPARSSPERLRRRANRVCKPPNTNTSNPSTGRVDVVNNNGFPSLGFNMPSSVPSSLDGWWSDQRSEIGFLGFSYSVSGCMPLCDAPLSLIYGSDRLWLPGQSAGTLKSEFKNIRNKFNGRYVRLYGACDRNGF